jgi:hypothetical protein
MAPKTRESNPTIYIEQGRQRVWVAQMALTMPHDPDPRALSAVTLQQVQRAAVEHTLLN